MFSPLKALPEFRLFSLALAAVMPMASALSAVAQSESHLILVVPPLPSDPADSAFALDLAEKLRQRVRAWDRRVVSYREMCRMLRASDFSCRKLMQEEETAHLAAALGANAYLTGTFSRTTALVLELRVTSRTRAGFAGSVVLQADPGLDADSVVSLASEGLDALWIAGALARRCYEARDEGEYSEAVFYAEGARSLVPNQSVAALCLATVYELTDQPVGLLINAYAEAVAGDPRLVDARRRLVTLYLEYGDTLSANLLLAQTLREEPSNQGLRAQVAFNWIRVGRPDSAFKVLREGEEDRAENLNLLRLISRACLEREMWRCQYEALSRQYPVDSALAGDTTFYYRIVGAAQQLEDAGGVLQWTTEGIRQVQLSLGRSGDSIERDHPALRPLWMAHAHGLAESGARDSAVAVYLRLGRADTMDVRPLLAAAEVLTDPRFLGIDSAAALDTAALRQADSLLTDLARRRGDDAVQQTIATIYFTPAAALVQARAASEMASAWLEKAVRFDREGRLHETASSLNGLALSRVAQQLDARIREDPTCELVDRLEDVIERAREAALAGRAAFPDLARQVLEGLEAYRRFVPQYREILQCREPASH